MNYNKVFKQIARRWYIVITTILLALIISILLKGIFVKTEYKSSANCYVSFVYDSENGNDLTDGMLNNFLNLSKTSSVLMAVAEDASIKMLGYTSEELTKALDIYRQNNLVVINCKMRDPIDSQLITQAYLNSGLPKIKSFLNNNVQDFQYTIVSLPEEGKAIDSKSLPIYLLSIIIGGMVGVALTLIPLMRGKVAYEYTEIQPLFNTRLLAVLPDKNMRQVGKKPIDTQALLMQYDAAIGAVISAVGEMDCQSFMIVPCSDKIDICDIMIQLGRISAQKQSTVVVDMDFRNKSLSKQLNMEQVGLSDYILGKSPREKIEVSLDGFTVIPTGNSCAQAVPLLLAASASELVNNLKTEYKCIALVAPPINNCLDGLSIGKITCGAALVIDAMTKSRYIRDAIDKLDQNGIKILGIIMANYPKY